MVRIRSAAPLTGVWITSFARDRRLKAGVIASRRGRPGPENAAGSGRLKLRDDDLAEGGRYLQKPFPMADLTDLLGEMMGR